jgi:hypothetical protein
MERLRVLRGRVMRECMVCRGKVIKGQEAVVRSRYDEDVYPGDHSSVWGSYWADGKWGYACCKSHLKNALCMGDRVQQVAQQQRSRQAEAAEQSRAHDKSAAHDGAADGSGGGVNGASDTGVNSHLQRASCVCVRF